jgi:hypothetical protein
MRTARFIIATPVLVVTVLTTAAIFRLALAVIVALLALLNVLLDFLSESLVFVAALFVDRVACAVLPREHN